MQKRMDSNPEFQKLAKAASGKKLSKEEADKLLSQMAQVMGVVVNPKGTPEEPKAPSRAKQAAAKEKSPSSKKGSSWYSSDGDGPTDAAAEAAADAEDERRVARMVRRADAQAFLQNKELRPFILGEEEAAAGTGDAASAAADDAATAGSGGRRRLSPRLERLIRAKQGRGSSAPPSDANAKASAPADPQIVRTPRGLDSSQAPSRTAAKASSASRKDDSSSWSSESDLSDSSDGGDPFASIAADKVNNNTAAGRISKAGKGKAASASSESSDDDGDDFLFTHPAVARQQQQQQQLKQQQPKKPEPSRKPFDVDASYDSAMRQVLEQQQLQQQPASIAAKKSSSAAPQSQVAAAAAAAAAALAAGAGPGGAAATRKQRRIVADAETLGESLVFDTRSNNGRSSSSAAGAGKSSKTSASSAVPQDPIDALDFELRSKVSKEALRAGDPKAISALLDHAAKLTALAAAASPSPISAPAPSPPSRGAGAGVRGRAGASSSSSSASTTSQIVDAVEKAAMASSLLMPEEVTRRAVERAMARERASSMKEVDITSSQALAEAAAVAATSASFSPAPSGSGKREIPLPLPKAGSGLTMGADSLRDAAAAAQATARQAQRSKAAKLSSSPAASAAATAPDFDFFPFDKEDAVASAAKKKAEATAAASKTPQQQPRAPAATWANTDSEADSALEATPGDESDVVGIEGNTPMPLAAAARMVARGSDDSDDNDVVGVAPSRTSSLQLRDGRAAGALASAGGLKRGINGQVLVPLVGKDEFGGPLASASRRTASNHTPGASNTSLALFSEDSDDVAYSRAAATGISSRRMRAIAAGPGGNKLISKLENPETITPEHELIGTEKEGESEDALSDSVGLDGFDTDQERFVHSKFVMSSSSSDGDMEVPQRGRKRLSGKKQLASLPPAEEPLDLAAAAEKKAKEAARLAAMTPEELEREFQRNSAKFQVKAAQRAQKALEDRHKQQAETIAGLLGLPAEDPIVTAVLARARSQSSPDGAKRWQTISKRMRQMDSSALAAMLKLPLLAPSSSASASTTSTAGSEAAASSTEPSSALQPAVSSSVESALQVQMEKTVEQAARTLAQVLVIAAGSPASSSSSSSTSLTGSASSRGGVVEGDHLELPSHQLYGDGPNISPSEAALEAVDAIMRFHDDSVGGREVIPDEAFPEALKWLGPYSRESFDPSNMPASAKGQAEDIKLLRERSRALQARDAVLELARLLPSSTSMASSAPADASEIVLGPREWILQRLSEGMERAAERLGLPPPKAPKGALPVGGMRPALSAGGATSTETYPGGVAIGGGSSGPTSFGSSFGGVQSEASPAQAATDLVVAQDAAAALLADEAAEEGSSEAARLERERRREELAALRRDALAKNKPSALLAQATAPGAKPHTSVEALRDDLANELGFSGIREAGLPVASTLYSGVTSSKTPRGPSPKMPQYYHPTMQVWEQERRHARKDRDLLDEQQRRHEETLDELRISGDVEGEAKYLIATAEADLEDPLLEGSADALAPKTGGGGIVRASSLTGSPGSTLPGGETPEQLRQRIALATQLKPTTPEEVKITAGILKRAPTALDKLTDAGKPSFVSLVPAGFRSWAEVADKEATNKKRSAKTMAKLASERAVILQQRIKPANPVGTGKEASTRQLRVSTNIHRVLEGVLGKRLVKDDGLYVGGQGVMGGSAGSGMPIEIAEVEVTPCLRKAYVRWMLPLPVRSALGFTMEEDDDVGVTRRRSAKQQQKAQEDKEEKEFDALFSALYGEERAKIRRVEMELFKNKGKDKGTAATEKAGRPTPGKFVGPAARSAEANGGLDLSFAARVGLSNKKSRDGNPLSGYGLPKPVSKSAAMMISRIAERHSRDRGLTQIDPPRDPQERALLRLLPRQGQNNSASATKKSKGLLAKEWFGDEADLSHLPQAARDLVLQVSAALQRSGPALRRAVGLELKMRAMPALEWHRYVAAEKEEDTANAVYAAEALQRKMREKLGLPPAEDDEEGDEDDGSNSDSDSDEDEEGEEQEEEEPADIGRGRRRAGGRRRPRRPLYTASDAAVATAGSTASAAAEAGSHGSPAPALM